MWFELRGDERLKRCMSEGCHGQQTWRLESGGIGSNYCSGCKENIQRLQCEPPDAGKTMTDPFQRQLS